MIQNYLAEPLVKNYMAPTFPLFIALKNSLFSITSKKAMRDAKSDISSFVQKIGPEGEKFVLMTMFEFIELPEFKQKSNSSHKLIFLAESIKDYSTSESFLYYFPEVVSKICKDAKLPLFLVNMSNALKLSLPTQITVSLSLYLSDRKDYSEYGEQELLRKLVQLRKTSKGSEIPEKILEEILFQISRNPEILQKCEEQYNYLLDVAQTCNKLSEVKIYNYFKGQWQFFANEAPILQKPPSIGLRKVDFIRDLGPPIIFKQQNLKAALSQIGPLNQEDVFECLFMFAEQKNRNDCALDRFATNLISSYKKNSKTDLKSIFDQDLNLKKTNGGWNVDQFILFCSNNIPNLKWQAVFNHFDRAKLIFSNDDHFLTLLKYFEKTKKLQKWKTPENLFFKKWSHLSSQATFLCQVFKLKEPEILYLNEIPNKKIQKSVKDCASLRKQIWGYLDLLQLFIEVSDFRLSEIKQILEIPLSQYPQLLLLSMAEIRPSKGQTLLDEVYSQLLPHYLHNHSTNIKLLENLWEANQDLVVSTICEIYKSESKKQNSFNLSRVLDITQSIRDSLIPFTTWNDYEFSIPLAVIAGKRQFLNFQPWIIDRIEKIGNSFIKAMLVYIDVHLVKNLKKMGHNGLKQNILQKAQLTIQLLNKIFYSIMSRTKREDMAPRNFEYLKRMFKQSCQYFPEIAEGQIPDEIQRETERQINRIYKEEISIREAIQRMKKLKSSNHQQDQQQLASHITFLCSELTYHHSYPEKELMITAQLFAAIINANLIEKKVYQMFLHVLEQDLKQDNQKYRFAIKVMELIKEKLSCESWFCEKLVQNDLILKKDPEFVQDLIKSIEPPKILALDKEKKIKDAIKAKNAPLPEPTLVVLPVQEQLPLDPIKKVQPNDYDILQSLDNTKQIFLPDKQSKLGKINMICNTLSMNNIDDKAKDLERILDSQKAVKLLAYNIVFKRISITQNNGTQIFSRLIERLPKVEAPVLSVTYRILRHWFALSGKSSVNDKKLANFKNIGSWLGKLTIGKGVPVPFYKLNLKNLLISSFANGTRINMNVPVVIKILEYVNLYPEIFRSTSPWLSRLFGTLNQIEDKLKDDQSAKSEIKAFFKSTSMKLDSFQIPQTSYLNSNNRIVISELDKYIKVDQQMQKYYAPMKIDLKMIITRAVDDSIQEIVQPVIDRAVKIAKVTTKQLIMKDFALEPDPDRFRESSYNVVKKMAGPLAQVTCREPLKASMNRSLKNLLSQTLTDQSEIESIIQKAIPDNLDFGCQLIKQAVIESAEDVIKKDSTINESIQMRMKAIKSGEQFRDDSYLREIPSIVPEQLRPRSGGLTFEEYSVYNEFKKQRLYLTPQKSDCRTSIDKIFDIIQEKGPTKNILDILQAQPGPKEQIVSRVYRCLIQSSFDEFQMDYLIEVCEIMKDYVDMKETWRIFKEQADIKKKDVEKIVKRLVKERCLQESCLEELDMGNDEEERVIHLFKIWLNTAHEQIQPFLRDLEENFNMSENQIKIFFNHSLNYAMKQVRQSIHDIHQSYDTNYIQDYSKLIIISYKTIASNNCSLYLQHTIQAIIEVFNRLISDSDFSYQRPFFKLFTNLICDVTRKEYDIDNEKILTFYCVLAKELQKISPLHHPSFAFAWVELISNKNFMPSLLDRYEYWDLYFNLLAALLKFVRQYITEESLYGSQGYAYQCFYKGLLKLVIIIIHDFPDFLSSFSLQLCLFAGPRFIQLNNMIISAYPKQLKFEFPLKVVKKEELEAQANKGGYPKYYRLRFDKPKFRKYLQLDSKEKDMKEKDLKELREKLANEEDETLQTFILYLASPSQSQLSESESIRKLAEIIHQCDEKLKLRLINFAVNLIRYPNSVTLLLINFACFIIFKQAKDSAVKDALLINILSRMNAESPQAWGLIYLAKQLQMHKNDLNAPNVPKQLLDLL